MGELGTAIARYVPGPVETFSYGTPMVQEAKGVKSGVWGD